MAPQNLMLMTLLLATGVTASALESDTNQQCTNQQCDTVNELSGAANSAPGRFQGDEELNLLQERISVHSAHAAHSRNGATLSTSGTAPANFSLSTSGTAPVSFAALSTKTKLPIGVSTGYFHLPLVKWHPRCRWPFPHLKPMFGSQGDQCVQWHYAQANWFCPDGCTGAVKDKPGQDTSKWGEVPYCIQGGTRDACEVTTCTQFWRFWTAWTDPVMGSRVCRMTGNINYIPPRGCKQARIPGWSYDVTVDVKDPAKLCRVGEDGGEAPAEPTGMWTLVGTKNGGGDVSVEIEVGFVSSQSQATTKAQSTRFFTKVEASVSMTVGVPMMSATSSVKSTTEFETTSKLAQTVKSASESSSTHTVKISCPGVIGWMTWVYQWQIADSDAALKSENFRCHYSMDGNERPPQCPPNACGNPGTNPYCLPSPINDRGKNGRDTSCVTHDPTDPGCWVMLPNGCPNHPTVYAKGWNRDTFGETNNNAAKGAYFCEFARKAAFVNYCGPDTNPLFQFIPTWEMGN